MPETKEILKQVKKIEISTNYLVEELLQGMYHSVFKGMGIEFSEVREYIYGDDIRTIDWNVTARMGHPYVKEFIEERNLTIYIVLDVSASNEFGNIKEKKRIAIELAASLMFAAIKNNDRVGLILFSDEVEKFIPPRTGKRFILKLIREMLYYKPKSKSTNLTVPLIFLSKIVKKKSAIFVFSDFFSIDFSKSLRILKNKHDVIAINLRDEREESLPEIGYVELEDEETGETIIVNTSDSEVRENFKKIIKEKNDELTHLFRKLKIDVIKIRTDETFEIPLRKFFKLRRNKR